MARAERYKVLHFIRSYVESTGEWPTRPRIAAEMGWNTSGGVSDCISALVRYGLIERIPFAPKRVPLGEQYKLTEIEAECAHALQQ